MTKNNFLCVFIEFVMKHSVLIKIMHSTTHTHHYLSTIWCGSNKEVDFWHRKPQLNCLLLLAGLLLGTLCGGRPCLFVGVAIYPCIHYIHTSTLTSTSSIINESLCKCECVVVFSGISSLSTFSSGRAA